MVQRLYGIAHKGEQTKVRRGLSTLPQFFTAGPTYVVATYIRPKNYYFFLARLNSYTHAHTHTHTHTQID